MQGRNGGLLADTQQADLGRKKVRYLSESPSPALPAPEATPKTARSQPSLSLPANSPAHASGLLTERILW